MKIIEIGNKETEFIIDCPHCKSKLGYIKSDIITEDEELFGYWHWNTYIICPNCYKTIILSVDGEKYNY